MLPAFIQATTYLKLGIDQAKLQLEPRILEEQILEIKWS
jgi:hypothetical protein